MRNTHCTVQTNGNLTIIPLKRHVSGKALKPLSLPGMFKATATWEKYYTECILVRPQVHITTSPTIEARKRNVEAGT